MSNPWFRMYAEFAHDPKVQMLSEAMQRRYIMLMCMRCSNVTATLHEPEIAFHLRISDADLAETKAIFLAKGFIDDQWNLINWEKRQFASDSSAARVARHRDKKKTECNVDVTLQKRECNALDTDTDTDTEKAKEKINKKEPASASRKPVIFPDDVNEQVTSDFIQLRKAKKSPLTQTALDGIKREAVKAGISLQTALETCCQRGWAGFKAEWLINSEKVSEFKSARAKLDEERRRTYENLTGRSAERDISGEFTVVVGEQIV